MRKIIDVLRLHYEAGLIQRSVAQYQLGSALNYLNRARLAELTCSSRVIGLIQRDAMVLLVLQGLTLP